MNCSILDRLFSPVGGETFVTEYWGQRFVHVAGKAERFLPVMDWTELGAVLERWGLEPPRLRLVQDGKPIDPIRFLNGGVGRRRLNAVGLIRCLSEGATLVLDQIDDLVPAIAKLTDAVEETFGARTTANLYAGWRTQKGFDLHWDPQDVIILQVAGRKRWKVYRPTRVSPLNMGTDLENAPQPLEEPVWDGLLEDGDVLYLPRGWWHVAYPLDEPSLHLTVTIVPADGVDLLRWISHAMKRHPEIRMNVPNCAGEAERRQYLGRIRELLLESLQADTLDRFISEWRSNLPVRPRFRLPLAPSEQRAPIVSETLVRLATVRRLVFDTTADGDQASFVAGEVRGTCSKALIPALERLTSSASQSVAELCTHLSNEGTAPQLTVVLTALAMKGALWTEGAAITEPDSQG